MMMQNDVFGYAGRSVVVAGGGGSGMGAATVEVLLRLGADVTVLDRREPPGGAAFHQTDLSDAGAIDAAVERLPARVDALFNCQGVSGTAVGMTPSDVMAVNFLGVRHLTEALLPRIPDGGAVASISSAGGLGWARRADEFVALLLTPDMDEGLAWCKGPGAAVVGDAFPHAYVASKQALIMWTMQCAGRAIERGVRVNVTSPGSTTTAMAGDFPSEGVELMNYPSGRSSEPAEQAWPLVFLNSLLASYVNEIGRAHV
jgi:NAD(P)-dependent dehydrogenase (short-subunit alcohol dehydrogenase family)